MLQKGSNIYFDFRHLFEYLLDKLPTLELELFLVQAWLLGTREMSWSWRINDGPMVPEQKSY